MHPLARPGNKSGAYGMKAGDRIVHIRTGEVGTADEFLPDGDVFISLDVGLCDTVKWGAIRPYNPA